MTVATASVSAASDSAESLEAAAADWSRPEPGVASDLLPDPGFFEGAEKLLELAFDGDGDGEAVPAAGLRRVTRAQWAELLKLVRCEIVSATSSAMAQSGSGSVKGKVAEYTTRAQDTRDRKDCTKSTISP